MAEDEPKKKRTADRQITKDDGDDEDNDNGETKDGSFAKANEDVLKKRRIVRAKRPAHEVAAESEEKSSSSNPFAGATLTGNKASTDEKPKVFGSGSGFAGFGAAAAASTTTGFGSGASSGGGFGSGTGFKGFGTAPASTGFGFGTAASAKDTDGTNAGTTPNLFDTSKLSKGPASTAFAFGSSSNTSTTAFGSSSGSATKTEDADKTDATSPPSSPTKPAVKLPEEVNLATGEENEKTIVEIRVKSFKLVESSEDETNQAPTQEANAATPSVPPSSSSFNKPKAPEEETAEGSDSEKKDTADGKKPESTPDNKADEDKPEKKWQDIGVGPLRLLEGGPNKYRLVQRYQGKNPGDRPTKVLINLPFWKESSVIKTDTKYLQLDVLVPTEAKKLEKQTYSLKFKTEGEASELFDILLGKKEEAKSCLAPSEDESKDAST